MLIILKKNNTMILGDQAEFKIAHLKPFLELLEGLKMSDKTLDKKEIIESDISEIFNPFRD